MTGCGGRNGKGKYCNHVIIAKRKKENKCYKEKTNKKFPSCLFVTVYSLWLNCNSLCRPGCPGAHYIDQVDLNS